MSPVSPPHTMHNWLLMQWCCDGCPHGPPRVACSTVQLVAKCRVSPSLYSRWLRPGPSSWAVEVITIRLVRDRKWSPCITGDLIAIKCWSRQALIKSNRNLSIAIESLPNHRRQGSYFVLWHFLSVAGHHLASVACPTPQNVQLR